MTFLARIISVVPFVAIASIGIESTVTAGDVVPLVLPGGNSETTSTVGLRRTMLRNARIGARFDQQAKAREWAREDLVQIIVVEQSTERIDQRRDLDKEALLQAQISEFSRLSLGSMQFAPVSDEILPGLQLGGEKGFQSQGRYQRRDEMSDRFSAKVVEVKPNGNLVVEARVVRNWSGDQTEITLTGVVNPEWITDQDTILSSQISDLKLDKQHRGPVESTTQRGIIAEALDFLFAF